MDEQHKDLGTAGTHHGTVTGEKLHGSVRATRAQDVDATARPVGRSFVHERNEEEGWERLRLHSESNLPEPSSGVTEMGRYVSNDEIAGAIRAFRDQKRWIVLENTRTGEVTYHEELNVTGTLSEDGRFDQVTVFSTQEAAASYADRVQNKSGR